MSGFGEKLQTNRQTYIRKKLINREKVLQRTSICGSNN